MALDGVGEPSLVGMGKRTEGVGDGGGESSGIDAGGEVGGEPPRERQPSLGPSRTAAEEA